MNFKSFIISDLTSLVICRIFWDEYKQETKINLVISGSAKSLMQKIFTDHNEPLFGQKC